MIQATQTTHIFCGLPSAYGISLDPQLLWENVEVRDHANGPIITREDELSSGVGTVPWPGLGESLPRPVRGRAPSRAGRARNTTTNAGVGAAAPGW